MSARGGIISLSAAGHYTPWIQGHGSGPTVWRVWLKGLTGSGATVVLERSLDGVAVQSTPATYTTDQNTTVTENSVNVWYRLRMTVAPSPGRVIDARLLTDALFAPPY